MHFCVTASIELFVFDAFRPRLLQVGWFLEVISCQSFLSLRSLWWCVLCGVAAWEADTPELNQVITPPLYMVVVVYGL